MTAGSVFKLYANCIPVKGARRSIICDLQTSRAQLIPNDCFTILTEFEGATLDEIKAHYDNEQDATIDEYFDLLLKQDYGFICDEPDRFPRLNLEWDRPEPITNAIVDIDRTSRHDFANIFFQLDEAGCQALQVRDYDGLSFAEVESILEATRHLRFRHVDLVIKYRPEFTEEALTELGIRYQVISRILVHSSPAQSRAKTDKMSFAIRFFTGVVTPASCGEVAPGYFSPNLEHFTEALHFNTCLNRKISISVDGHIKACPAMDHSCGRMGEVSLRAAVRDPVLVQLGAITKDQVSVCRDCEFRYICTDCRAFLSEPSNLYSKPAKCSYDPYTATWGQAS
ncbi:MAG TPA: grasp-with-spasm system SPASM domain peptide maturase [Blastocatellia bacterium]|nr:grasp-with-spasm system SPASM domain peptide maturase [Blastocatellia bacterium]